MTDCQRGGAIDFANHSLRTGPELRSPIARMHDNKNH